MITRHTLVWLQETPHALQSKHQAAAVRWHAAGHPFIVTRTRPGEALSLGFCLPRTSEAPPQRVCAASTSAAIVRHTPPPTLDACADSLPQLRPLLPLAAGLDVRLFGSFLWQSLTRESYATAQSDLDLLVTLTDASQAATAVTFYRKAEALGLGRIDGELSFPGLGEVNWREFARDAAEVVVKSCAAIRLIPRTELTCLPC